MARLQPQVTSTALRPADREPSPRMRSCRPIRTESPGPDLLPRSNRSKKISRPWSGDRSAVPQGWVRKRYWIGAHPSLESPLQPWLRIGAFPSSCWGKDALMHIKLMARKAHGIRHSPILTRFS